MIHFGRDTLVSLGDADDSMAAPWLRFGEALASDSNDPCPAGGLAGDRMEAYRRIADKVRGTAMRAANLGARSPAATAILDAAGIELVSGLGVRDLNGCDALVMVDTLGRLPDDRAALRAICNAVARGTRLVGAVLLADPGRAPVAGQRLAFSPESLDALLVGSGWGAPTLIGRAGELLVFETTRASSLEGVRALDEALRPQAAASAIGQIAAAVERCDEPAMVRELLLALGGLQIDAGEIDAAEQAMTAANAIAPNCARPFVALAAVASARHALDDAEALLDHALSLDAACLPAWRALASISRARGELARARECDECAAAIAPGDAELAIERARALSDEGEIDAAIAALEGVLDFAAAHPGLKSTYCWLVATATRHRRPDQSGAYSLGALANMASLAS